MRKNRVISFVCALFMFLNITPISGYAAISAGGRADGTFLIADFLDRETSAAWGTGPKTDGNGSAGVWISGKGYEMNWVTSSGGSYFANNQDIFGELDWSRYKYLQFSFYLDAGSKALSKVSSYVTIVLSTAVNAGEYDTYKNNECLTYEIDMSKYGLNQTVDATIPLSDFVTQFDGMKDGVQGEKDGTTDWNDIKSISILGSGIKKADVNCVGSDYTDWAFSSGKWASAKACGFIAKELVLQTGDAIELKKFLDSYMTKYIEVSGNLVLPTAPEGYNGTIQWLSSDESVIATDGTVTPSAKDKTVTLTAIISGNDGSSRTSEYEIVVTGYAADGIVDYYYNASFNDIEDRAIDEELEAKLADRKITTGWTGDVYDVYIENGALVQRAKIDVPNGTQPADSNQINSSYQMLKDGARQYYEICFTPGLKKEINFAFASVGGTYNSFLMTSVTNSGAIGFTATPKRGEDAEVKYVSAGIKANSKVRIRFLFDTKNDKVAGFWVSVNGGEFKQYNPYDTEDGSFGYHKYQASDLNNRIGFLRIYASGSGALKSGDEALRVYYIKSWKDMSSVLENVETDLDNGINEIIGKSGVIRGDIRLPAQLENYDGVKIDWQSSNTGVLSNDGKLTMPSQNTPITLTAHISFDEPAYEDIYADRVYDVLAGGKNDDEYIIANDVFYGTSALNSWDLTTLGGSCSVDNKRLTAEKGGEGSLSIIRPLTDSDKFQISGKVNIEIEHSANLCTANGGVYNGGDEKAVGIDFSGGAVQKAAYVYKGGEYSFDVSNAIKSKIELDTENSKATFKNNGAEVLTDVDTYAVSGVSNYTCSITDGSYYITGFKATMPNAERLPMIYNQLTWDKISKDPENAVSYLELPKTAAAGVSIDWTSSDSTVVNSEGNLFRPENDTPVILTAKIYKDEDASQYIEKTFNITVPAADSTNIAYGKTAESDLTVKEGKIANITDGSINTYFSGSIRRKTGSIVVDLGESVPLSSVKLFEINGSVKNFTIDVSGDNSTWKTVYTGTSIGDGLNMKFSPTYGRYVRLNVTEASAKPVAISEFEVRFNSSDSECVAADTEALVIQSAYKLAANLTLPQSGIFGSGIIWSSSNTGLVSNSGVILERPAKDTVIIMKAKIQKGSASAEKSFSFMLEGRNALGGISGGSGGSGGGSGSGSFGGGSSSSKTNGGSFAGRDINAGTVTSPVTTKEVFSDLSAYEWAKEGITALYNKGIVSGNGSGGFEPERKVRREEFLKMLLLTLGVDMADASDAAEPNPFKDCDFNAWYYPYVIAAYRNGITDGINADNFGIGEPISRQDMAVMIHRACEKFNKPLNAKSEKSFADSENIGGYAKEAVCALGNAGIFSGDEKGNFNPSTGATRAEVATVMYKIMD